MVQFKLRRIIKHHSDLPIRQHRPKKLNFAKIKKNKTLILKK